MITEGRSGRSVTDKEAEELIMDYLTQDGAMHATLEYVRLDTLNGDIQLKVSGFKVVIGTRQGNSTFHVTRC